MQISDDDLIRDGKDLDKLRHSTEFNALLRLLERKKSDLFDRWIADPKSLEPAYCQGVRDVLDSLVADVEGVIAAGEDVTRRRRELQAVLAASGSGESLAL